MAAALAALLLLTVLPLLATPTQAQSPANPYSYSHTSSFTYYGRADGVEHTEARATTNPYN